MYRFIKHIKTLNIPPPVGTVLIFIKADPQLREQYGISLTESISHYQDYCRKQASDIHSVFITFDKMLNDQLFTGPLARYENAPAREIYAQNFHQQ